MRMTNKQFLRSFFMKCSLFLNMPKAMIFKIWKNTATTEQFHKDNYYIL